VKRVLSLGACLLCLSVALWAQVDADYQGWMKSNGATVASLRKNLDAKAGDAAAADAKTLADNFGHVHDYWQKKNVSDAVKYAGDAQSGFKDVAQLAAAGKFDDAAAALKTAQTNCAGCHMAHRDKAADGSFSIK
jgi:mono/diheme cytochrome c family protein